MTTFGCKTPVSILQEYLIANGQTPSYQLLINGAGTHNPTFVYRVQAGDDFADGTGNSKQQAKHNAAQQLIEILTNRDEEANQLRQAAQCLSLPQEDMIGFNAVGQLTDFCAEKFYPEAVYDLVREEGPPHEKVFTYKCSVSHLSDIGTARTKKQAKHQAAHQMLKALKKLVGEEFNAVAVVNNKAESSPQKKYSKDRENEINEKYNNLTLNVIKRTPSNSMYVADQHRACINLLTKSDMLFKIVDESTSISDPLTCLSAIAGELGVRLGMSSFPETDPVIFFVKLPITPVITFSGKSFSEAATEVLDILLSFFK